MRDWIFYRNLSKEEIKKQQRRSYRRKTGGIWFYVKTEQYHKYGDKFWTNDFDIVQNENVKVLIQEVYYEEKKKY